LGALTYLKFINSNVCFLTTQGEGGRLCHETLDKFIFVNTNYAFRKNSSGYSDYIAFKFDIKSGFFGAPLIRWFYDSMYEFVNLSSGRNIRIAGVIYPEFDQNQMSKLVTSTTTDISIGHTSQNKSIKIDYTVQRNIAYAEGAFSILSDSSDFSISVDRYIKRGNNSVDASALIFDIILDGSIIKWRNTLDASGGDASINYNISRVMRTPLTI